MIRQKDYNANGNDNGKHSKDTHFSVELLKFIANAKPENAQNLPKGF